MLFLTMESSERSVPSLFGIIVLPCRSRPSITSPRPVLLTMRCLLSHARGEERSDRRVRAVSLLV